MYVRMRIVREIVMECSSSLWGVNKCCKTNEMRVETETGMPVSKLCVFTGFETGRCLYIWWQIKQSAEIGAVVSVCVQYSPLQLLPLTSIYILHSIETYWCSEKQTEAGKFAKIVYFSAVEKHLIRLEGPEDPHLTNSRFLRSRDPAHASLPLAQIPWGLTGRAWLQAGAQQVAIVVSHN